MPKRKLSGPEQDEGLNMRTGLAIALEDKIREQTGLPKRNQATDLEKDHERLKEAVRAFCREAHVNFNNLLAVIEDRRRHLHRHTIKKIASALGEDPWGFHLLNQDIRVDYPDEVEDLPGVVELKKEIGIS